MHSELWNVSLEGYRNGDKEAELTKEIPDAIDTSEIEIRRTWNDLRCKLNSRIRKIKSLFDVILVIHCQKS